MTLTFADRTKEWMAPTMFLASFLFLTMLSALLVLWIDVPRVVEVASEQDSWDVVRFVEPALSADEERYQQQAFLAGCWILAGLVVLWTLFVLEAILAYRYRTPGKSFREERPYFWIAILIPPLRMCMRDRTQGDRMWLPTLGWQVVDRSLRRRMEKFFSIPMMWIALLILPVLVCQMFFKTEIIAYPWLRLALHISAGIIWLAFALEFVVMVSVSHDKGLYCLKHWLDIIIIVLPLVSFIRALSILKASNVLQLAGMHEAARMVRVYRVRGVALRGLRAFIVLNVFQRLFRISPQRRLARLKETVLDKQDEIEELQRQIQALEATIRKGRDA